MRGDLKEARDAEYWGLGMTRQIILFICHRTIQGCLVYLLGRHTLLRQSVIKPGLRSKLSAFDLLSNCNLNVSLKNGLPSSLAPADLLGLAIPYIHLKKQ